MRVFIYDGYIINADNDTDADRILADQKTVRELLDSEISSIFGEYAHLAGPWNTAYTNKDITFSIPTKYTDFQTWLDLIVRPQRNAKLAETDKYMIPDYPISTTEKAEWETYRQALRDLPESLTEIVSSIPWPTAPSV